MATSGTLKTSTIYDSYFWVKWSQSGDQDIANNRTKIAWSCGVYCGHNFYSNAIKMSAVTINGTTVYNGGTYSNYYEGDHTIASGTMWIAHTSNGTKTFSISSFTGWLYSNYNYSSAGASYDLTKIPRAATIVSAPDFNDTQLPTVTYSNEAGAAVEALDICMASTDGKTLYAEYRAINKTGTLSYTFTSADVVALKNVTVNSLKFRFYIRTKIGGVYYYSSVEKTFTMTDNTDTKPTVSMSVAANNGSLSSLFGNLYIQGKSKLNVTISATGKYKSSITSYSAKIDGQTYSKASFTSDAIKTAGTITAIGYATDSRGFTGSVSKQINVVAYSAPRITSFTVERQADGTTVVARLKGEVSPVENKNTKSFSITLNGVTKTISATSYTIDGSAAFTGIPTDSTLIATATINDAYNLPAIKNATLPTVAVTMDFHSSGTGVAFGKVAETANRLDVAWPILMKGGIAPVDLVEGQDLNDIRTTGLYRCSLNNIATSLVNCPTVYAFSLLVEAHAGSKQTLTTFVPDAPSMYIRNSYMGEWGPWFKVTLTQI